MPAISCFALSNQDLRARVEAAEDYVEQSCRRLGFPVEVDATSAIAQETLWHPAFPAEYIAAVCRAPLHELGIWLDNMDNWANNDKALDFADYAYLADCLREGIADDPTPLAALRLARALAWVERAGAALLPAEELMTVAA